MQQMYTKNTHQEIKKHEFDILEVGIKCEDMFWSGRHDTSFLILSNTLLKEVSLSL